MLQGKGGSMHFFDVKKNFLGGNGIVGAYTSGYRRGLKIRNKNERGLCSAFLMARFIRALFTESLNMAQIWGCRFYTYAKTTSTGWVLISAGSAR